MNLPGHIDVPCSLCGSEEYKVYTFDQDHYDFQPRRVKCKRCGLVYANPQATFEKLKKYYSDVYAHFGKTSIKIRKDEFKELVESNIEVFRELNKNQSPGKFLDVGCGMGYSVEAANQMGWEGYGVELSTTYCDFAVKVKGVKNIMRGDIFKAEFPNNFFDYVLSWHTIEHVLDPKKFLLEIHRVIKRDSTLKIGTPHINSFIHRSGYLISRIKGKYMKGCTVYEHTYEFTPKTIKRMLNECGFQIEKLNCYWPSSHERPKGENWKGKMQINLDNLVSSILPETKGVHMEIICKKV